MSAESDKNNGAPRPNTRHGVALNGAVDAVEYAPGADPTAIRIARKHAASQNSSGSGHGKLPSMRMLARLGVLGAATVAGAVLLLEENPGPVSRFYYNVEKAMWKANAVPPGSVPEVLPVARQFQKSSTPDQRQALEDKMIAFHVENAMHSIESHKPDLTADQRKTDQTKIAKNYRDFLDYTMAHSQPLSQGMPRLNARDPKNHDAMAAVGDLYKKAYSKLDYSKRMEVNMGGRLDEILEAPKVAAKVTGPKIN